MAAPRAEQAVVPRLQLDAADFVHIDTQALRRIAVPMQQLFGRLQNGIAILAKEVVTGMLRRQKLGGRNPHISRRRAAAVPPAAICASGHGEYAGA